MRNTKRTNGQVVAHLSEREKEVARLACSGLRNKEIARELGISDTTVKLHLHHIYEKLGIATRRQLGAILTASALIRGTGLKHRAP
jgi:ATP/maltotriose-dependent transcriptional regulator MalT